MRLTTPRFSGGGSPTATAILSTGYRLSALAPAQRAGAQRLCALAQTRSVDRIKECLSLEGKRKHLLARSISHFDPRRTCVDLDKRAMRRADTLHRYARHTEKSSGFLGCGNKFAPSGRHRPFSSSGWPQFSARSIWSDSCLYRRTRRLPRPPQIKSPPRIKVEIRASRSSLRP